VSQRHFFATPELDRAAHRRRDPGWVRARLDDPSTLVVPVWRDRSLVDGADPPGAVLLTLDEAGGFLEAGGGFEAGGEFHESSRDEAGPSIPPGPSRSASSHRTPILLGTTAGAAYFALDLSDLERSDVLEGLPSAAHLVGLRRIGAMLDARDGGLLAYARAMVWWHRNHSWCGLCGAPTRVEDAGHLRRCTGESCRTEHFPRTDPAIIVRVTHGERCLLGRQPSWPANRYSVLAGFVEPGESLEQAVRRELREEARIDVDRVRYHSSQPWPFPASLMVGFTAEALRDEIHTGDDELEEAFWIDREALDAAVRRRELRLPPRFSISRRLIEEWRVG